MQRVEKPNTTFVHYPEHYKRELNIREYAIEDIAHYLHLKTKKSWDTCMAAARKQVAAKQNPIMLKSAVRKENGDRELRDVSFDRILEIAARDESVLTPNLVMYDSPKVQRSFTGEWILKQRAERTAIKKRVIEAEVAGSQAEKEGNHQLKEAMEAVIRFGSSQESTIKFLMNSISGARLSKHNPLFHKTVHSTLTSICRVATSYSNASTERLLCGNRHYHNYEVTRNNILTLTRYFDRDKMKAIVDKYGLTVPTAQDCFEVILRASRFYWRNEELYARILDLLNTLDDMQRCAFAYTGDIYHLRKHNEKFVRDLITSLISPATVMVDDPDYHIKNASADMVALNGFMCVDIIKGKKIGDVKKNDPEGYIRYASEIAKLNGIFEDYDDLIQTLLVTPNIPASVYYFPSSIRRSVVGSDTDSTMFTVQEWVIWYFDKLVFHDDAMRVANVIGYFSVQLTVHWLAMLSRQLGVIDEDMYRLSMKNEFYFAVYLRANRAKHYLTLTTSREGQIFAIPKLEVKGVSLRDSKIPPALMKEFHDYAKELMMRIYEGKQVSANELLHRVAMREQDIMDSVRKRETKYLSTMQIKSVDAYKNEDNATYKHYSLWQECFAPLYGDADKPPYIAYKLPVTTDNAKRMKAWLDSIPADTAKRIIAWVEENKKSGDFSGFLIPKSRTDHGFPQEFLSIIDERKTIIQLMAAWYILLEIFGLFYRNESNTRLVSDEVIIDGEFIRV